MALFLRYSSLTAILLCTHAISVHAQITPDAGALLRENQQNQRQSMPDRVPNLTPQAVPKPVQKNTGQTQFLLQGFKFTGNSLISESELQLVVKPWLGREVVFEELQQVLDNVSDAYRRRSWFARPMLPAQEIDGGIVTINILESRLGAVRLDDGGKDLRIEREFVNESMTARQKPGDMLNLELLDRSNNLLNDTPGVTAVTILAPGQNAGESDAIVKVQDKPMLAGIVQLDNTGAKSTGDQKYTFSGTADNPTGKGDQIALNGNTSLGSDYLRLGYTAPIGFDGLRVGGNISSMQYTVLSNNPDNKTFGNAQTIGLTASYPLLRSGVKNVSLNTAIDKKHYYNEAAHARLSEKDIDTVLLSVSGDMLDQIGNGGMWLGGLSLTTGNVGLAKEVSAVDTAKTEGGYHKWSWNMARLQRLTETFTFWFSANGQVAGKNLDSSEKFSLGGPSGVRAYPLMEGTGDNGWLATTEIRYNFTPTFQAIAFYDHGEVQQNLHAGYIVMTTPNDMSLEGSGLGASWSDPGNFTLKAVWARRMGDNPLRAAPLYRDTDGSLDLDRFWLTLTKFF